jgi:phage-related baseplate assembly protein
MKGPALAFFVLVFASKLIFAADNYTVQSVSGKVEREVSANKWEAVTAGMTLSPSTVVDLGLQAMLILSDGEETVTIKPRQKGTIETLLNNASSLSSGVRMTAETGTGIIRNSTGANVSSDPE